MTESLHDENDYRPGRVGAEDSAAAKPRGETSSHALQSLTAALLECVTPSDVVAAVVGRGVAVMGAEAGLVVLVRENRGDGERYLDIVGASGYSPEVTSAWRQFPLSAHLPLSDAVREQTLLFSTGRADMEARYPDMVRKGPMHAIKASVSLPLIAHGRAFGGLHFSFPEERASFAESDRVFLTELARQCALAMDRALLLGRLEDARAGAEASRVRQEFLARASAVLGESLDYTTRLEALVRLCVPEIADWAAVDVLDGDDKLIRLAVAHRLPERESVIREVQERYSPESLRGPSILTVIRAGERIFQPNLPPEAIDLGTVDAEHARLVKAVGLRSLMCLPIQTRGRTLGAISLGMGPEPTGSGRLFTHDTLGLIEEVARRAADAVDNARLFAQAQREILERRRSDAALQSSEGRYRRLLETALEGILFLDTEARISGVNQQFVRMMGYDSPEEIIGNEVFFLFFPEDQWRARNSWNARLGGVEENYELRLRARDNTERWFIAHVTIERNEVTQAFQGTFTLFTDITERRRVETELAARNAEIATVFERVTDAFAAFDSDWNFIYLNGGAERILGKSRAELIGKSIWKEFPEGVDSMVYTEYLRAQREQVPVAFEVYYGPLLGWFEVRAYPSPTGLSAYFRNVTELKEAENERETALSAVRESQDRLRLALASGGMGTWDIDLAAGVKTLSEEIPPLYGRPRTAMTISLAEWNSWLHPDERHRIPDALAAALRGEADYDVQFRTLWPDGVTYRWVATRALIRRDETGKPIWVVGYTRDVTEERERESEREGLLAELREANIRQKRFLKEMLAGFTEGRLRLCFTEAELPAPLIPQAEPIELTPTSLRQLRKLVEGVAETVSMPTDRLHDFETAVHEAGMNAVKYGGGGTGRVFCDPTSGTIQVWVEDQGPGIAEELIHRAVERGFTTAGFGHGMYLMRSCADRMYLLTGPIGTTVVLEQDRTLPEPDWLRLVDA